MTWLSRHWGDIGVYTLQHIKLAGLPLVLGLLIALPLGWLARRHSWAYAPLMTVSGLLYTIPSLALFVILPAILGTSILSDVNVIVALTLYSVALLVRTVADGLGAVPQDVRLAADAMGYRPVRRFLAVDLPLAVPVIAAGLRVAAVSNVSIVSVAALLGTPQLGMLFTDGFNRGFLDPIVVGIIACLLLALAFDVVILAVSKLLTPWARTRRTA